MINKSIYKFFKVTYKKKDRLSRKTLMNDTLLLCAPTAQKLIETLVIEGRIKAVKDKKFHPLEKVYEVK